MPQLSTVICQEIPQVTLRVIRKIKAVAGGKTPIVVSCPMAAEEYTHSVKEAGADELFVMPVTDQLIDLIARWCPMIESEWLRCAATEPMLKFVQGTASARKLRLFACACCRRIWHLLVYKPSRHAVEVAEAFADGKASSRALEKACGLADTEEELHPSAQYAAFNAARDEGCDDSESAAAFAVDAMAETSDAEDHTRATEEAAQCDLLRHIFGNPFRPLPSIDDVPTFVRKLAEGVYQQNKTAIGPLHDALLDAGLTDLAEHFTDPNEWHPKGCWALDLLTKRS